MTATMLGKDFSTNNLLITPAQRLFVTDMNTKDACYCITVSIILKQCENLNSLTCAFPFVSTVFLSSNIFFLCTPAYAQNITETPTLRSMKRKQEEK